MKVLNLAYSDRSEISYKISKFPDGQQTVDIESIRYNIKDQEIKIISRMNTFKDLELIIAANQALLEMEAKDVHLYIPYFIGARSDRKFREGGVNYLKKVICPIINSQNFKTVTVLDPHSDVLEACLNNYEKNSNLTIVKKSLVNIDNKNNAQDRIVLISPDGGALKKIYDVAEHFQIANIVTAMKHRDIKTGKITHTSINLDDPRYYTDMKFVIVDDICDGGRTFIELAKAIQNQIPNAKIYLIVTHGIFSAGFTELSKWFEKIFTSNSFKDIKADPEDTDTESAAKEIVTQFDIF